MSGPISHARAVTIRTNVLREFFPGKLNHVVTIMLDCAMYRENEKLITINRSPGSDDTLPRFIPTIGLSPDSSFIATHSLLVAMEDDKTTSMASSPSTTSTTESLVDVARMKLIYFGNDFPSDNLQDLFRRLYHQSQDRSHPNLARFIQEATLVVREEVRALPAKLQSLVPAFETIFDLADLPDLRQGPLGGLIDGMLLCVVHIAALIG